MTAAAMRRLQMSLPNKGQRNKHIESKYLLKKGVKIKHLTKGGKHWRNGGSSAEMGGGGGEG